MSCCRFLLVVFSLGLCSSASGQEGEEPLPHPLQSKELARARYQATQSQIPDLRQEQLRMATWAFLSRFKQFHAGQGTLDNLLVAAQRLLEADRANAATETDHRQSLERYWERLFSMVVVQTARHEAGRVPIQDLMAARYAQAAAELRLVEAAQDGQPLVGGALDAATTDILAPPLDAGILAKAERAALTTNSVTAYRTMLESAQIEQKARLEQFLAGQGTLDNLLDTARRLVDAERRIASTVVETRSALERYWRVLKVVELVASRRYEDHRIPVQNSAQTRFRRIEAELLLKDSETLESADKPIGAAWHQGSFDLDKELARARLAATRSNPADLQSRKLEAIREEWEARQQQFLAGQGTLFSLEEATANLRDTELATCTTEAERKRVLEHNFDRWWCIERTCKDRFEAGRLPGKNYFEPRCLRIEAEITLKQFPIPVKVP